MKRVTKQQAIETHNELKRIEFEAKREQDKINAKVDGMLHSFNLQIRKEDQQLLELKENRGAINEIKAKVDLYELTNNLLD